MQSAPTKILFFSKLTSGNLEHKIKHIFHLQKESNPYHNSPSPELAVYDRKAVSGLESLADNMALTCGSSAGFSVRWKWLTLSCFDSPGVSPQEEGENTHSQTIALSASNLEPDVTIKC